jgi:hypothetical protein
MRTAAHMHRPRPILGIALLLMSANAFSIEPVPLNPESDEPDLEVVLVRGEQPGPGLWKVTSGEHVLWILGEVSPIPRKVRWRSQKFEQVLRDSQELLLDFSGYWQANFDEMSAYRRAEKLPDGVTLADVISPQLHARVESTAKMFDAPSLEKLYPFAATNRLVTSAMKRLDLNGFSARFAAEALAKERPMKITRFLAPESSADERLKTWQQEANAVCLERVVDTLEDGGTGLKRLANAWSIGDIDSMRRLVPAFSFSRDGIRADECAAAMRGGEERSREYDIRRVKGWLEQAERALRDNRSTVAVVLMSEILASDGYLAALRERGYDVVEPH